jgi:hypothetical protein
MEPIIRDEFAVHILNAEGLAKARILGAQFSDFLDAIEAHIGKDGREMALVRTKLQEASYFAKRALAVQPANQQR